MKKRSSLLLLSVIGVSMLLAGCNPGGDDGGNGGNKEPGDTYSLMKFWAGNASEEIYSVEENETSTVITYTDAVSEGNGGWEFIARSFAYDTLYIDYFDKYEKLTFTGNLETTSGTNEVMIKFEGAGSGNYEKRFTFEEETRTYELPLNFISDWSQVSQITLFVNRGANSKENGSGVMTFTDISLSTEPVNPENNIAPDQEDKPQEANVYAGETDKFNVMKSWGYDNTGTIKTTENSDGTFKFDYDKDASPQTYAYASAKVEGDLSASGFKRLHFAINGTAGQQLMVKFQTHDNAKAKELTIELTGEDQTVDIDITQIITATYEADGVTYTSFIAGIFPLPGATSGKGSVTLKECYMDTTDAVIIETPVNTPDGDYLYLTKPYKNDSVYDYSLEGNKMTINYEYPETVTLPTWASLMFDIDGENLTQYTKLTGTITSTVDVQVLLKSYDNNEKGQTFIDLKANEPYKVDVEIDSSIITKDKDFIIIIGTTATSAKKGTVVFENLRYEKDTSIPVIYDNEREGDELKITNFSVIPEQFTLTNSENSFDVDYKRTQLDWNGLEATIGGDNLTELRKLTGTITATVNTDIIIKQTAESATANEIKRTLTANTPLVLDEVIPEELMVEGAKFIIMIATPNNSGSALEGKVTFTNLKFVKYEEPAPVVEEIAITSFTDYSETIYSYTYTENTKELKIAFDKTTDPTGYPGLQAKLNAENLGEFKRVTGKALSDVNQKIIIKVLGSETRLDLKAGEELIIDFVSTGTDINAMFAIMLGVPEDPYKDAIKGNVTFTDLKLTKVSA